MQTRIYRALGAAELRRLRDDGSLGPAPFTAYAVTTELRAAHPGGDEEELEYLAFGDAAGSTPGVRVVAAADVDEQHVTEASDAALTGSAVRVDAEVARRRVASFHVADAGVGTANPTTGEPSFSWYDATELDVVIDLVDRGGPP